MRLHNIFKTANVTNLTKVIKESSYRILQVTSKQKTLKQPSTFQRQLNFALLLTFKLTLLWLYFRKSCKTTLFRKPTEAPQNTPTFISIEPLILKERPFKNMKNLCYLGGYFFKKKNGWHLEFAMNQIFGQRFIIFQKLRYRRQLLLKLRAVEFAASFH